MRNGERFCIIRRFRDSGGKEDETEGTHPDTAAGDPVLYK